MIEVDAQGRRRWTETFPVERLGDAIVRLYARHAEPHPAGPERVRAEATAVAIAYQLGDQAAELERAIAPDIGFVDHRPLGFAAVRGAERFTRAYRAGRSMEQDRMAEIHEILAHDSAAILVRETQRGHASTGGGAFERPLLVLAVFAEDGHLYRNEWFDPDQLDQALARFEALVAEPPARFANAAWRTAERYRRACNERDLVIAIALHAADPGPGRSPRDHFVVGLGRSGLRQPSRDLRRAIARHRPLGFGQLDAPTYVASLKALAELSPDARWRLDHEWRCERGALRVLLLSGTREGGAFEDPRIVVYEHDSRGQEVRHDVYALDQLDLARARFAELAAAAAVKA